MHARPAPEFFCLRSIRAWECSKFHKAHGEAHHEHEKKGGLQRMNSVNEKLMEADVHKMLERKSAPKFHAGTWIKEESEDYPNREELPHAPPRHHHHHHHYHHHHFVFLCARMGCTDIPCVSVGKKGCNSSDAPEHDAGRLMRKFPK